MIYLDSAATSYPKPEAVIERVTYALREFGSPGRSSHRLSMIADREVFACRVAAAEMFGTTPERVIFTQNTTMALNMAMKTAYRTGGIVISDLEHNSVRRPALALTDDVRIFDSHIELSEGRTAAVLASIERKCRGAKLLISTAASNICGATLPIAAIGKFCRERGITFIVDGAQAGGIHEIDMRRDNIDILCLPGHKGLYGPGGTGMMLLSENIELPPFMYGGSGVDSLSTGMPDLPPERFEAGTLAAASIAGLRAGIEFVRDIGIQDVRRHEEGLAKRFREGLAVLPRIKLIAPETGGTIVLFKHRTLDPEETARELDRNGICVRAGYHCAPLAHQRLSTGIGGAVRASFSVFNSEREVDEALGIIRKI